MVQNRNNTGKGYFLWFKTELIQAKGILVLQNRINTGKGYFSGSKQISYRQRVFLVVQNRINTVFPKKTCPKGS